MSPDRILRCGFQRLPSSFPVRAIRRLAARCVWAVGAFLAAAGEATACAVCFSDPESALAQGAVWGVAVLLGVVCTVLAAIGGMILFWIRRSRRMAVGTQGLRESLHSVSGGNAPLTPLDAGR